MVQGVGAGVRQVECGERGVAAVLALAMVRYRFDLREDDVIVVGTSPKETIDDGLLVG